MPPGDNLTITLATELPGSSATNASTVTSRVESPGPAYYSQHLQQQQHVPYGVSASCGQCTALGWQPAAGGPSIYGGKLLAVENPASAAAATSKTSHPYHRNQSLKASGGEPEDRPDGGGSGECGGMGGTGGGTTLTQSHPFLWLGLKIGLM
uniref:Uncharacterized protein n=1 Tax=Anopheles maculatus TaxID=74869 RepID=A0A182T5H9_9DIPT